MSDPTGIETVEMMGVDTLWIVEAYLMIRAHEELYEDDIASQVEARRFVRD